MSERYFLRVTRKGVKYVVAFRDNRSVYSFPENQIPLGILLKEVEDMTRRFGSSLRELEYHEIEKFKKDHDVNIEWN